MNETRTVIRFLRRTCALALAFVGVWALSLTVDLSGGRGVLEELAAQPGFAVGVFAAQMDTPPGQEEFGWPKRLLLASSAHVAAGVDAVSAAQPPAPAPGREPIGFEETEESGEELPTGIPEERSEVVVHTAQGRDDGSYLSGADIYLKNTAGLDVDLEAIAASAVTLELPEEGPQILIVHTHGSEAYTMFGEDLYVESDPYRTTNCNQNVVRVGAEMAEVFREQGFQVLHDTNLYDYPVYNSAYTRSCAAVEKWMEEYPTIRLVLDVHRDALVSEEGVPYKLVAQEGEERVAQVMLVVGSNDAGAQHPNWRENLALAVQMQLRLSADHSQLARPITLRSSRYNQHLSPGSLLVEVGGHGNTLAEALAGARLFAESTAQLLREMEGS